MATLPHLQPPARLAKMMTVHFYFVIDQFFELRRLSVDRPAGLYVSRQANAYAAGECGTEHVFPSEV